jgi:hypothetical protein
MAKLGVLTLSGKSGTQYKLDAYPLNTVWTPISAIYVITHRDIHCNAPTEHVLVHLGQTQNLQKLPPPPPEWTGAHRANCLCLLEEPREYRRKEILADIAAANSFATATK